MRRQTRLESEANRFDNITDVSKQRSLYRELLRSGNYKSLINRFETQSQLPPISSRYSIDMRQKDALVIQQDPECLNSYVKALEKDGQGDKVFEKITQLNLGNELVNEPSDVKFSPSSLSEPRNHIVRTNLDQWDRATGSTRFSRMAPSSPHRSTTQEPIQVVISEAWSWGKFSRKIGTRILYGVLILTGLSVVLDQQGMIKSGKFDSCRHDEF